MRVVVPVCISGWRHIHVGKAITDVERDDIAFVGDNTLGTTRGLRGPTETKM
jgi:hypothetical protein